MSLGSASTLLLWSLAGVVPAAALDPFPYVRAARADLDVRPERWETRSTLPGIEAVLSDPLTLPDAFERLNGKLKAAKASADMVLLAAETLGVSVDTAPIEARDPFPADAGLPPAFAKEAARLVTAIEKAQPLLDKAIASVPAAQRAVLVSSLTAVLLNRPEDRLDPALFDAAERFDLTSLFQAAYWVARAADEAIPGLAAVPAGSLELRRLKLPIGNVLFAGASEEAFNREDLEDSVVLISLGDKSRYLGPAAAAGEGKIRVVIDLSKDISLQAAAGPRAAGAGVFGIGLLYMPRAEGTKVLQTADLSQGAGLFGVGGLFLNKGEPPSLTAGRFAQGAGAFGAGLFDAVADSATLTAVLAAQGFGFTKGVGLFRLRGDGGTLECGLTEPDPREEQATLSFCQGTALGVRAFAAGGVGLAVFEGSDTDLRSGYFAQGSGYWHGLGGLSVAGDGNRLRARRYSQGAGVHTAAGALSVTGSENHLLNWGVGPAYGWDWGVGSFTLDGDNNTVYAEWGTGHGDVNGHAMARVRGERNELFLPEFGSGAFKRGAPSYGLVSVEGAGNRIKAAGPSTGVFQTNPWGVLVSSGLSFDPKLSHAKPVWPKVDGSEPAKEQAAVLDRRLEAAAAKPEPERYADWLSIASAFGVAGEAPRRTLFRLLALPPEKAPDLARLVSPDQFDEYLWLRAVLAGLGAPGAAAAAREAPKAAGTRRALLVGLQRFGGSFAVEQLAEDLKDKDWRVRREAAAALGWVMNKETGEEPGRLAFLQAALTAAATGRFDPAATGTQRIGDGFALLAMDPELKPEAKIAFASKVGGPTDPLTSEAYDVLGKLLAVSSETYRGEILRELSLCRVARETARKALAAASADADLAVAHAALVSLGQAGAGEDAPLLETFLSHPSALLREAAAAALGKLGKEGRDRLVASLGSKDPARRALAATGLGLSPDLETLQQLLLPFDDSNENVRRSAVAALDGVQSPLRPKRGAVFAAALKRLAASDPSSAVRAAAAWQLTQVNP